MQALRERLLAFLRDHKVLTLAVVDADGPHAAALFYAVDDELCFYVVSDPGTRHGAAMLAGGEVAGTVQRDRQEWREIQGVQFRGRCRQLTGKEREPAGELYAARFPFVRESRWPVTALWRIEPDWMRLVDNRLGFGHKEEWTRKYLGKVSRRH